MAAHAPVTDGRRARFFYVGIALAAAVIVFVGFSRTYFLKTHFGTPPLSRLLHLHGLVFTSWIVLLLTQVSLVAARRTDLHRRLGVLGALLAPLMVAIGLTAAIDAARRGSAPPGGRLHSCSSRSRSATWRSSRSWSPPGSTSGVGPRPTRG